MQRLWAMSNWWQVRFSMLDFGAPTQKPTLLYSNRQQIAAMQGNNPVPTVNILDLCCVRVSFVTRWRHFDVGIGNAPLVFLVWQTFPTI